MHLWVCNRRSKPCRPPKSNLSLTEQCAYARHNAEIFSIYTIEIECRMLFFIVVLCLLTNHDSFCIAFVVVFLRLLRPLQTLDFVAFPVQPPMPPHKVCLSGFCHLNDFLKPLCRSNSSCVGALARRLRGLKRLSSGTIRATNKAMLRFGE